MKQNKNKVVAVVGATVAFAAATVFFSVKKLKKNKSKELRFLTETAESASTEKQPATVEEDKEDENKFSVEEAPVEADETVAERAKSIQDILRSGDTELGADDLFQ